MNKYNFIKDVIIDFFKFMFIFISFSLVTIFITIIASKLDEKREGNACYEIYATDGVILKKCQKYFDEGVE